MDDFFKISEQHAREVKAFENDRQETWNNLQRQHNFKIPVVETQRFNQEWVQKQKEMISRQHTELSKVVEPEISIKNEERPTIIKKPKTLDEIKAIQEQNQKHHQKTLNDKLEAYKKEILEKERQAKEKLENNKKLTDLEKKEQLKKELEAFKNNQREIENGRR